MTAGTISHYRILQKLAAGGWVRFTLPKTRNCIVMRLADS